MTWLFKQMWLWILLSFLLGLILTWLWMVHKVTREVLVRRTHTDRDLHLGKGGAVGAAGAGVAGAGAAKLYQDRTERAARADKIDADRVSGDKVSGDKVEARTVDARPGHDTVDSSKADDKFSTGEKVGLAGAGAAAAGAAGYAASRHHRDVDNVEVGEAETVAPAAGSLGDKPKVDDKPTVEGKPVVTTPAATTPAATTPVGKAPAVTDVGDDQKLQPIDVDDSDDVVKPVHTTTHDSTHESMHNSKLGTGAVAAGAAAAGATAGYAATRHTDKADSSVADTKPAPVASTPSSTGTTSPASTANAGNDDVAKRFGAGAAASGPGGAAPAGYSIKGNADSMLFHTPDSPRYEATRPEVWFKDEQSATAAGFAHWDRSKRTGASGTSASLADTASASPSSSPSSSAPASSTAATSAPAPSSTSTQASDGPGKGAVAGAGAAGLVGGAAAAEAAHHHHRATAPVTSTDDSKAQGTLFSGESTAGDEVKSSSAPAAGQADTKPDAAKPAEKTAATPTTTADAKATKYGAGAAAPLAGGAAPSGDYPVKGNEDSMLYHTSESPSYKQTRAEVWFKDEAAASAAGFKPWNHKQREAGTSAGTHAGTKAGAGAGAGVAAPVAGSTASTSSTPAVAATPAATPATPASAPAAKPSTPAADEKSSKYGAGAAAPLAGGAAPSGDYTVKGNEDSMLFHTKESPYYGRTVAEVWFKDESSARAAGFKPWNHARTSGADATATAGTGADGSSAGTAAAPAPVKAAEPEDPMVAQFGPGAASPGKDGAAPSGEYVIKGNADSMMFHTKESPSFQATIAEVWFKDEESAKAAGFKHWDHRRR